MIRPPTLLLLSALLVLAPARAALAQDQRWTLNPVWEIGAVSGDQTLTAISSLAADADETVLAVGQPVELRVKLYETATGNLIGEVGRRGGGPGEFQGIRSVWMAGDTLTVVDARQRRVSRFSTATGEHLWTGRVDVLVDSLRMHFFATAPRPGGGFWAGPVLTGARLATGALDSIPIATLDAHGQSLTVVDHYPVSGALGHARIEGSIIHFTQPFATPAIVAEAPDGSSMLIVRNGPRGEVRVRRLNASGAAEYAKRMNVPPRTVSRAARDSVYEAFARRLPTPRARRVARREAPRHVNVPEHYSAVTEAMVTVDGRAWLRLSDTHHWLLLSPTGAVEGQVAAPPGVTLLLAGRRSVYGVRKDELDVPYIVRYDLSEL